MDPVPAHVIVVGVGSIGCSLLPLLVGIGPLRLTLVDGDTVEAANLVRQTLYGPSDVGRSKVEVAAERLAAIASGTSIRTIPHFVDGGNADMPYCSLPLDEYVREANANTFIVLQIEEEAALAHAEEMLAVDGVDALFLGPGDYSSIGGFPGQMDHPKLQMAMERIAAAARSTGKHWGRPVFSLPHAQTCMDLGARLLTHSSDLTLLKASLERMQQDYESAGFAFHNQLAPAARRTPQG